MSVIIKTPCRLHFGLIDMNGALGRIDGGVGLALNTPNVIIEARLSNRLEVTGRKAGLARGIVKMVMKHYKMRGGAFVKVIDLIPEHVGLGSTTQLSLAIAKCLTELHNIKATAEELATVVKRGGTSGIGVAAFEYGGFILDGGHTFGRGKEKECFLPSKASKAPPPPILARYKVPYDWLFVLVIPNIAKGAHGEREVKIFTKYCPITVNEVRRISHIILMKILPSVASPNIEEFGEGLSEIQNFGFKKIEIELQHPIARELISKLKEVSYGTGMSSFGPTVYALVKGRAMTEKVKTTAEELLSSRKLTGNVIVAEVNNSGASLSFHKSEIDNKC
jgi:beta-ribofuranosylaminobenzene 5'-phosphate synthase